MLQRVLVTDDSHVRAGAVDLVLWVGRTPAPASLKNERRVVEAGSHRAASMYLAGRPAVLSLELDDPLGFAAELAAADKLPALRAA